MSQYLRIRDVVELVCKARRAMPLRGIFTDTMSWAEAEVMALPFVTINEWIPCSERLPEYRKLVLVTTRDLRVKPAYLDSIQDNGTNDLWSMPLDDADCALWNIVAWMPLPQEYRGDSE